MDKEKPPVGLASQLGERLGPFRRRAITYTLCCIAVLLTVLLSNGGHRQAPLQWRLETFLTAGSASPDALRVIMVLQAMASPQGQLHYRQQLWSLLESCDSPISLYLITPTSHVYELAPLLEELSQLAEGRWCRLHYTILREEEVGEPAGGPRDEQRGRRLLTMLSHLAPLGKALFLDEQTFVGSDLSGLRPALAAFSPGQLAAAPPEGTARYLSEQELRPAAGAPPPEPGVSGRVVLLDLARLAAEPAVRRLLEEPGAAAAGLDSTDQTAPAYTARELDAGLQADMGALLTRLRRRRPDLVHLLPCAWGATDPDVLRPLDEPFRCAEWPRIRITASRRERSWERALLAWESQLKKESERRRQTKL